MGLFGASPPGDRHSTQTNETTSRTVKGSTHGPVDYTTNDVKLTHGDVKTTNWGVILNRTGPYKRLPGRKKHDRGRNPSGPGYWKTTTQDVKSTSGDQET